VVAYRVSDALFRQNGVPNEERSLFIAGHEIHHFWPGLVIASLALCIARFAGTHLWLKVVQAIGIAMMTDELVYLTLTPATDTDYPAMLSLSGCIAITTLVTPWFVPRRRHSHS
jgi:hypothetical protein